jgi:hypothetical protein
MTTELLPELTVTTKEPLEYQQPKNGYECSVVKIAQVLHLFGETDETTLTPTLEVVKREIGFNPTQPLDPGTDIRYLLDHGYEWHDYRGPACIDPTVFYDEGTPYFREMFAERPEEFHAYWTDQQIENYRSRIDGLLEVFTMPTYSYENVAMSGLETIYQALHDGYIADVTTSGRVDAEHDMLITKFNRGRTDSEEATNEQVLTYSYFTYADPDGNFRTVGNKHGFILANELVPQEPVAGIRKAR